MILHTQIPLFVSVEDTNFCVFHKCFMLRKQFDFRKHTTSIKCMKYCAVFVLNVYIGLKFMYVKLSTSNRDYF